MGCKLILLFSIVSFSLAATLGFEIFNIQFVNIRCVFRIYVFGDLFVDDDIIGQNRCTCTLESFRLTFVNWIKADIDISMFAFHFSTTEV